MTNETTKAKPRSAMGRLFQRKGSTRWWIQYYVGKKQVRESSKSEKRADAARLMKVRFAELGKGRPMHEARKVTLVDLKALIVGDYALSRNRSARRLEHSWKHLVEFFGETEQAVSITAPRLSAYVTRRTEDGAAPATVKCELSALKRAFNLAKRTGTLLPNEIPAAFPTITLNNRRKGFMEDEEHEAIVANLPLDEGHVAEFLSMSGWRKSEALGLQWRDVDISASVMRIEDTKNGDARTLAYNTLPDLIELIRKRREITDEVQKRRGVIVPHVFARDGEPIRYFRRAWISACIAAGLGKIVKDEKGKVIDHVAFRIPHDYRRSAARNLSRAGVPETVIMSTCGWKTRSVFDRYNIVNEADISAGFGKLAAMREANKLARVTSIRQRA